MQEAINLWISLLWLCLMDLPISFWSNRYIEPLRSSNEVDTIIYNYLIITKNPYFLVEEGNNKGDVSVAPQGQLGYLMGGQATRVHIFFWVLTLADSEESDPTGLLRIFFKRTLSPFILEKTYMLSLNNSERIYRPSSVFLFLY